MSDGVTGRLGDGANGARNPLSITRHPSFLALQRRARIRWLLERLWLGLLGGLAGGVVIAPAGRLAGYPQWPIALLGWFVVSLGVAVAAGIPRWPGLWEAARAADAMGLEERVTSALFAADAGLPVASLLTSEASRALARIVPSDYPLLPTLLPRRALLMAGLLLVAMLLPLPTVGDGARRASEAQTIAAGRRSVEALQAGLASSSEPEPLTQAATAELQALDRQLAQAQEAAEAAQAMEEAQERLAGMGRAEDYAWQRALEGLAATWAGKPDLAALSRALETRDPAAVERALSALDARLGEMGPEERQQLQRGLQAGANAARNVPALAGGLRQAASQVGAGAGTEDGTAGADPQSLEGLSSVLAEGAARSADLQALQQAVAGLGQARAALGAPSGTASGGSGLASAGPPVGSASGAQGGNGSAGGSGTGAGSAGGGASPGTGAGPGGGGASPGTGSGGGPGSGSGSGSGESGGSGSGSGGSGGAGSGAGAGAGAGGGPARGQPGGGSQGGTTAGGMAAPNNQGATNYERIYAPSLMGGEGGAQVQSPGQAGGAGGETVELPDSPVTLGELRPYNEVYGQYESAARQSLSRQSLPPGLQGLVQRYFSSIAPSNE